MSDVPCPHCSQPIENDPSLAGTAVVCPHCETEFQFPEAPKRAKPAAPAPARRTTAGKTQTTTRSKPDGKPPARDKSQLAGKDKGKPTGKEKSKPGAKDKSKPAAKGPLAAFIGGGDPKLMAVKVAIVALLLVCVVLYMFLGRTRDYAKEKQAVLSYISQKMENAKFDSWHGEGIGKGCSVKNKKVPDDSVVLRAHVLVGNRISKFKKDIVFIVDGGRVTDEVDPRDFHLPGK